MRKLFPHMYDAPHSSIIVISAIYWFICYVLIPFTTTVMLVGSYNNTGLIAVFDLIYFGFNFLVMASLFGKYLKESFLNVQIDTRNFFITTFVTAAIVIVWIFQASIWGYFRNTPVGINAYPLTETSVLSSAAFIILKNPVAALLCTVLLTPVTISCLFYSTVFAPICCNRPWLAYLVMALLLLVPRLFNIWWLGYVETELWTYFLQLPVHMLACWSYQKTDTVWTPISVLALSNLASGLLILWFGSMGMIWVS